MEKQTLKLKGVYENIYGGFGKRLLAFLIDALIIIPIVFLTNYLHNFDKNFNYLTHPFLLAFGLWYNIYLPKKYGGTVGKLVVGLKILKTNFEVIGWKEAIMRYSIMGLLSIFSTIVTLYAVSKMDNATYIRLGWQEKAFYLVSFVPTLTKINMWLSNIWIYSEFFTLLFNKQKRAIHDMIAGTIIVKNEYIPKIKEALNENQ